MKILITGGGGFLGSHLCQHFVKNGDDVTCLDKLEKGDDLIRELISYSNFHVDKRDLLISPWVNPPDDYNQYSASDSPWYSGDLDLIFHFASNPSPKDYMANPIETLKVDSVGTLEMLKLAKLKNAVLVIASTGHIDFDPDPTNERTLYNEGKRFAEAASMSFYRDHGVQIRIVRMFNSYGPGMRIDDGRIVPTFIAKALKNEEITVVGGLQPISLTYVDDMIAGILAVMESHYCIPIELGERKRSDVLSLAEEIVQISGSTSRIRINQAKVKHERMPDLTLADHLGWIPKISLYEGLRRTIENFRDRI